MNDGDLAMGLADHADDVVIFDVPRPYEGVRGLAAYERTWPDFFTWQAGGAVFELETLGGRPVAGRARASLLLRHDAAAE